MIVFATAKTKPLVRKMWQTVFEEDDKYLDIYFSQKYKNENTLIYLVDDQPVASLQMWEYNFSFYGTKIPIYYLAGLATYEEHRRKGYMRKLIEEAHRLMKERRIPISVLIPAELWLFNFYEQFGYAQVFEKGKEIIPLKKILDRGVTLEKAFEIFERVYNHSDFTILKDFNQFKTIVEEQKLTDFEEKTNLDGVARVIDVERVLKLYAKQNQAKRFTIRVTGDTHIRENNTYYTIEDGIVSKFPQAIADFEVDIVEICELLMGHDNEEFDARIVGKFPRHKPVMNLMLE